MKQETANLFQFVAEYNRKRMSKCSFLLVAAFCLGLFQTQTNATPAVPTGLTVAWASFHQVALAWEDDAEGRLVREGDRHYAYGWLDKVLAVTGEDGETLAAYSYGLDNQLASTTVVGATEEFLWDGLALVRRGDRGYLNEPHANGGSPILSSGGAILFNDLLGSTLGTLGGDGYRPVSLTAFGDTDDAGAFFIGKPKVDGLGYAFLLRSYRPDHGKWLTADPLGYPDGWNQMAYCGNDGISAYDSLGGKVYWCSRDLAASPAGNHHFLTVIPDVPENFNNIQI